MSVKYSLHVLEITLGVLLLMACGASPAADPTATPDLVATEVAVKKSAAATLTAEAELVQPPATEAVPVVAAPSPTPTPSPSVSQSQDDTIQSLPATETPTPVTVPSTDTPVPVPPTNTPAPVPPTDTPPPPALPPRVDVPVDGGRSKLRGNIGIPGLTKDELQVQDNQVTFRDKLVFQVIAYDPNKGDHDGAGIKEINIKIFGPSGKVHERTERTAGYCVFGGGEPDCNMFSLKDNYRWPEEDKPIESGFHGVEIRITTDNNETEDWIWSFQIDKKN